MDQWTHWNKIPDLVEIEIDPDLVPANFVGKTPISMSLRVGIIAADFEGIEVDVGFNRLFIKFDCQGLRIESEGRLGEPVVEGGIKNILEHERTSGTGGELTVDAGTAKIGGNMKLSMAKGAKISEKSTLESEISAVIARPNGRWEIRSLRQNQPLEATYIHRAPICTLSPIPKANGRNVAVRLIGLKRDIYFQITNEGKSYFRNFGGKNVNKEKIMGVILSKCISDNIDSGSRANSLSEGECEISIIKNFDE
ncbi:hypothetical protein [Jiella pelagia]|uniref:Adhesin domain-containing protein n=1 Tax=Jiella pelagia TaxID=2986949 RepID=A0ABY7C4F4_9HYPH|nr:hypothetical protein [Jiella pelagia]WAP70086.1 hypothetical protein OH818_08105 [Jiella pelagia]